jgi:hypothetical protein
MCDSAKYHELLSLKVYIALVQMNHSFFLLYVCPLSQALSIKSLENRVMEGDFLTPLP